MKRKIWQFIDVWSKKIRGINYLGGKCNKCGDKNIFHLVFHHKNEIEKEFEISDFATTSWSKIKNELDKCELLCENCHQEYHFLKKNSVDKRRRNKDLYLEFRGSKCKKCNYDKSQGALTFHHRDKDDKIFNIANINKRIETIYELETSIIDELEKCDILCFNCHREIHVNINRFNKYKKQIYLKVTNFKEKQPKISRDEVYSMYNNGIKQINIAKYFNASKGTISNIIKEMKKSGSEGNRTPNGY